MKSGFYISYIKHERFFPKRYEFENRYFWTKFDLDELDELQRKTSIFSRNTFNLVTFRDHDHINLGHETLKENIQAFLAEQGVNEKIKTIEFVTNPRILGYVFNSVSFYFIEAEKNPYIVIEIGNTFKEQKPYLLKPENKNGDQWVFTTQKHFYISPFTSLENMMTFRIKRNDKSFTVNIDDFNGKNELEVRASFTGRFVPWKTSTLLKFFFIYPMTTLRLISSIHYHALKLFLMKVPYYKKDDNKHLQKDLYVWKDRSFRKRN
jgi:DUF1365 family protein